MKRDIVYTQYEKKEGDSQCQCLWSGWDPQESQFGEKQKIWLEPSLSAVQCRISSYPWLATNCRYTTHR